MRFVSTGTQECGRMQGFVYTLEAVSLDRLFSLYQLLILP